MQILEFKVPDADVVAFATGVIETLDYDYEYDETSPPDVGGECTYLVSGVEKK